MYAGGAAFVNSVIRSLAVLCRSFAVNDDLEQCFQALCDFLEHNVDLSGATANMSAPIPKI